MLPRLIKRRQYCLSHTTMNSLVIVGYGDVFDAIQDDIDSYGLNGIPAIFHRFTSVASISETADVFLKTIAPETTHLFVAVDSNALNHARLELYGRARLIGFKFTSLVHNTAILSPSTVLGNNVWIGPSAVVANSCKIDNDVFIGSTSRLDPRVTVSSYSWIGSGSKIGRNSSIGSHVVLGNDVVLADNSIVGNHVLIEKAGYWSGTWESGTMFESDSRASAKLIGAGYTFTRSQKT